MPTVRSRGGRRGRGRGGRGRGAGAGAAAASGTRRKRAAAESEVIEVGDDGKSALRTKRRIRIFTNAVDESEEGQRDAPKEAAHGSLKKRRALKDISNSVVGTDTEAVMEVRDSAPRNGGQKVDPHSRSKRLQGKPTRNKKLDGGDTGDDIFEDSRSSSQDVEEKLPRRRRSKRLRETYKSEYVNNKTSEDKDTSLSISDDDHDNLGPHRRTKRFGNKLGTQTIVTDDEDYINTVYYQRKVIPCRMSKRLQEKRKANHISDESCVEASTTLSGSSSSDDELLHNSVKASTGVSDGPICSLCKSGTARSHIQCQNSNCSSSFHTFCQNPPLQDYIQTSECSMCKINQVALANLTEEHSMKKIEKIVGHRMKTVQECNLQYQFLVKWHSLSHRHDCWVPLEWLQVFDRLRVQSYLNKNTLLKEVYSEDQRKPEWNEIDRAIACRRKSVPAAPFDILTVLEGNKNFEEYEFLVKWKGLDYCEATWEPYCTEGVQAAVDKLIERHQNTLKRVDCISPICQDGVIPEEVQNGALFDYQLQGLQWMLDNFNTKRNVILADEMGLGKTVQVVCFLDHIIRRNLATFPALVLAPKSILLQWEKEFGRWASSLNVVVYQGDKESRKCIQGHEMYSFEGKILFDALVTSYEFVQIDKAVLQKFKWSTIVIDEAHRMKKLDCNLATCLKRYRSDFRLLLTGTPLQNNMLELFSLLHYIDPDEFSDPNADGLFAPIESGRELTMEDKIARIHDILKPRMLRRMKSDVLTDSIPTKKWVEVPCALTDSQRELYIAILEKNYSKLNGAIKNGRKFALNNILMQLRKCCNHPYLFPGQETNQQKDASNSLVAASGKLQLLHKLLPRLKERGNRVLIFSQMTMMLDILEEFLDDLGYNYARIDGQTPLSARQESIKEYNRAESETFIFLMSTRAGGLGVDLPGADRVIIYDPDFNPFMDLQAQSRAHRIGQTRPVVVYQLITKCSVEEKILQKSKQKLAIENILMNSSKKPDADELQSILLHGAKAIIDRKKVIATSIQYDDEAIENLLKLDPSAEEKCSTDDNGYIGSIVSFAHGAEDKEPGSPKVEDLKVLKPVTPKVDLGRGKRQRRAVNYADAVGNSDSDDMYAPEGSSSSSSSSDDDDDHDKDEPDILMSGLVVPVLEGPTGLLDAEPYNAIVAPVYPVLEAPKDSSSSSSSSDDEKGANIVIPALEAPRPLSSSSSSSSDDDDPGSPSVAAEAEVVSFLSA